MQAIHFICRRNDGVSLNHLSFNKAARLFQSGHWEIPVNDAQSLIGGWLYLHPAKDARSEFGGVIKGFEQAIVPELARPERIIFFVEKRPMGSGQKWRGSDYNMAHSGQCVPADLPHEREA